MLMIKKVIKIIKKKVRSHQNIENLKFIKSAFKIRNALNVKKISENWETTKEKCTKSIINFDKKKNVLFFIGGNTDIGRQNIRDRLYKLSQGNKILGLNVNNTKLPLQIEIGHNRDLSEFTKFKYLLNLPGNQPWSYRFKYLFLTKSLVINIDVRQKFGDIDYFNGTWINFFDIIFEPNIDYINLEYYWIESNQGYNDNQFIKLIKNLELTYQYYDTNYEESIKMADLGFEKVLNITDDLISESIFLLVYYYAKKINQFL